MSRASRGPGRTARSEAERQNSVWGYLSQRPNLATDLLFVVPVLLIYQIGTFYSDRRNGVDLVTTLIFRLRRETQTGFLVLSVALLLAVGVLYLRLRRRERFQLRMLLPVLLESGVYAFLMGNAILFIMTRLLGLPPPSMSTGGGMDGAMILYISAGAGLHEELVFRLLLFGGLLAGLERFTSLRAGLRLVLALGVSAALFSGAHHLPPHGEPFTTFAFTYRLLAGVIFGLLYHLRGFSTAVYTHFLYDVLVLGLWS